MAHRISLGLMLALTFGLQAQKRQKVTVPELRAAELVQRVNANQAVAHALTIPRLLNGSAVVLKTEISESGRVDSLKLMSGLPLLVNAAVDAAKQWRFRPATRGGEPIPSTTVIWIWFPGSGTFPEPAKSGTAVVAGRAPKPPRVDLSGFLGVWDGDWTASGHVLDRYAEVTWTIGFEGGRLIRTAGSNDTLSYELDGSEVSVGKTLSYAVREITKGRITITERQWATSTGPGGSNGYAEMDESWKLSDDGGNLEVMRKRRVQGSGFSSLPLSYSFHRNRTRRRSEVGLAWEEPARHPALQALRLAPQRASVTY